ncbi:ankyrin repeat domain-containing protein [Salinisphaera sp. G21_0]|uniref:ankyrin repeat domain-containing protein n=1 Tax=Salinisphaera sp. G21_0 TaxID=2821094 RepID=UPI001AD9E3BE|nr:ankyrin repeat domain-containing protein [Salinisphaera sp. G21_0]MBO9482260.1 ankyrin repeat domain-containing protein [Salinisphaera sp. G21_0]
MISVTPEHLKSFTPTTSPVLVCHHLSMQPRSDELFNGRQLVVCENPDTRLIRSSDCQCDTLFRDDADIQELATLLQNRAIDIHAKKARYTIRASAYGPREMVYWRSPLRELNPNILEQLQWYLSKEGVDINQPINQTQQTLLHQFCKASCLYHREPETLHSVHPDTVVKLLLSHGASLLPDCAGNTPLHLACNVGASPELMEILLTKVNGRPEILDAVNNDRKTALSEALSSSSWVGIAVLLLRSGASIGDADNRYLYSPLHAMIENQQLTSEKLYFLTRYGLDINNCFSEGILPFNEFVRDMYYCNFYFDSDVLLYLLKAGLALNRLDCYGQSLLSMCFNVFAGNIDYYRKLELCSFVLKAAYKYHFPGNIDALKGAVSDALIEKHAKDIWTLLTSFSDVFYLIDNTIEIIASDLNAQNKKKLEGWLKQARDRYPPDWNLRPFVYQPCEPFAHSCKNSFMRHMDAVYNAVTPDFARVGLLESDLDRSEITEINEDSDCDDTEDHQGNHSVRYSDIHLYDWLFDYQFAALRQLLVSHKEIHKTISQYKNKLVGELSIDNKEKLDQLLRETTLVGES